MAKVWAEPLGNWSHAVFFMSTGLEPAAFELPYQNISADFAGAGAGGAELVCVRDLYTKAETGPFDLAAQPAMWLTVAVHDSAFFCVRPATASGGCSSPAGCPSYPA